MRPPKPRLSTSVFTDVSLPENTESRFKGALIETLQRLSFADSVLGVLVAGSVGRGQARSDSDLDVFVVVSQDRSDRRRFNSSDTEVDLFVDSETRIRALLESVKNPVLIENFALGHIAWDPFGIARELSSLAKKVYAGQRRAASPERIFSLRERAKDTARALRRREAPLDSASFNYLAALLVAHCVSAYYEVGRIWDPPPKKRMRDLHGRATEVFATVSKLLDTSAATDERIFIARSLVTLTFGSTAWHEVSEGWPSSAGIPKP